MQKTFLEAVAEYCTRNHEWELSRCTFVFPNQRASYHFSHIMAGMTSEELLPVRYITMAELMEKTAGLRRATPNQRLLWLYVAYCRVRRRHPHADGAPSVLEEFDRFRYWGEMLLRDFDEVDRYLVNQRELFKNVRDFKSLQSSFLTAEQLAIIKTYWGEDPYWGHLDETSADVADVETPFWKHMVGQAGPNGRFALLWELLGEVYDEFHSILVNEHKCYPGMAFRIAANKVRRGDMADFTADKYIFVGFSDLSTAELTVMDQLQKREKAVFFWDYNPELMGPDGSPMAGRFVAKYARHFPQPVDLTDIYPERCHVEIVAAPTNVGQAYAAMERLDQNSVLVLPSEDLLLPVLTAIPPDRFKSVSVSMGYPLKHTEIASLFGSVVSLQLRMVKRADGVFEFFRDDVMALLSHPFISRNYPEECQAVVDLLADNFMFNLPASMVKNSRFEALAPLFTAVGNASDVKEVMDYVESFITFVEASITDHPSRSLDRKVCEFLRKQTNELRILITANPEVTMRSHTFFHLVESAMFRRPIQLTGLSTAGLQVLGVLETRALSFDNVVVLSMSDRVFPGKRFTKSFIPVSLRRGFGLPTPDVAEANMAYNFYRLLSHASTATLLFDSRTGGLRSGDMSRFLYQLRFLDLKGFNVEYKSASFGAISLTRNNLPSGTASGVIKDSAVMSKLDMFRDPDLLKEKALSASALKKYINCPLSFYLEYIAEIKVPDEPIEDVDSATLGSIFHTVAERIYSQLRDKGLNPLTPSVLKSAHVDSALTGELIRAINIHKVKIPMEIDSPDGSGNKIDNPALFTHPLSREDEMLAAVVREMMSVMFEIEPAKFDFLHAEYSRRWQWSPLPSLIQPFNFTMSIDRIDRVYEPDGDSHIRIIDYKTGSDRTSVDNVQTLFTATSDLHLGGIFQLMLYCCAFADFTDDHSTPLRPLIYPVKNILDPSGRILHIGPSRQRVNIDSYKLVESEFRELLASKIAELFNPDIPFCRCNGSADKACRYCKFKPICGVS